MMENEVLNEKELDEQFKEFLHAKGIKAKFKLAFDNMKESTKKQHEKDIAQFNEVKRKSAKENKDFVEFLHTKGIKAKAKLVIENIKKGAKESRVKTKEQIEKSKQYGQRSIDVNQLNIEFNNFLKQKGLDKKYIVKIESVEE